MRQGKPTGQRRKVLFALIVVILALVALELTARAVEWRTGVGQRGVPPPVPLVPGDNIAFWDRMKGVRLRAGHDIVMVEDEERGWALPRGGKRPKHMAPSTRVNSMGLRGPEVTPRAEAEQRLFTMGDSSIFGARVAYSKVLSSVAAEELDRLLDAPVSAVIGAIPGYDSGQSLATLRKFGAKVQPTWVVIGNLWSDLYHGDPAKIRLKRRALIRGPLGKLALYRELHRRMTGLEPIHVRWMVTNNELGNPFKGRPTRISLEKYTENLEAMVSESKKLGARALFLILPAPMDFSDDISEQPTVERFRAVMRKAAAKHGAPLVDGPAVFKAAGAGLPWFIDNVHPSREGHELLGKAVADAIARSGR